MIIPGSQKSDSVVPTIRSEDSNVGPNNAPPSPPPYSTTVVSSDNLDGSSNHRPSMSLPPSSSIPSGSMPNPNAPPAPRENLPPRCNHLVERKSNNSISGTWHVDTALAIPERLLPPIADFDGTWNVDAQKARKEREKEMKKREREKGRKSSVGLPPLAPLVEVRPNLMLGATNGSVKGDVHVVSSDGAIRPATIVAQATNGSINLAANASPEQPLRIFAGSTNGSVNVRVPPSFEGAIMMTATWGSIKISDGIKPKLTTFSSNPNTSRCFIGDWQAVGFGSTPDPRPASDSGPPVVTLPETADPFTSWTGPLIHLTSTSSVSLSFLGEEEPPTPPSGFWNFVSGLFGGSGSGSGGCGSDGRSCDDGQAPQASGPPGAGPNQGCEMWSGDIKHPSGRMPRDTPDPA
ncbi:hypothetical protein BDV93DRAFT_527042 [Ceratobasidium sp. AG-I]|nr:hypothetical protein BDV93DRAFT_527042 [Ceratobasidium sp. AG-I]